MMLKTHQVKLKICRNKLSLHIMSNLRKFELKMKPFFLFPSYAVFFTIASFTHCSSFSYFSLSCQGVLVLLVSLGQSFIRLSVNIALPHNIFVRSTSTVVFKIELSYISISITANFLSTLLSISMLLNNSALYVSQYCSVYSIFCVHYFLYAT